MDHVSPFQQNIGLIHISWLLTFKCVHELQYGCKSQCCWWHWDQNVFHLAHTVFHCLMPTVFLLWDVWVGWNDETPFSFSLLSSKNYSAGERDSDMLKLRRTAWKALHFLLCLWSFQLSGLLAAALPHPSTPVCTPGSTMRYLIPPKWRLCLPKVLDSIRDWRWNKTPERTVRRSPVKSGDCYLNLVMT